MFKILKVKWRLVIRGGQLSISIGPLFFSKGLAASIKNIQSGHLLSQRGRDMVVAGFEPPAAIWFKLLWTV